VRLEATGERKAKAKNKFRENKIRDRQARKLVRALPPFENSQNVKMSFPWTLPRFGNSRNVEMSGF
jgi:hypothetical protein